MNDAVSFIRGLAEMRDRNAEWAEAAVRQAASLTARVALEQKVIDVVATDLQDLLRQLDGRKVKTRYGLVQLSTRGLATEEFVSDWRTKLLEHLDQSECRLPAHARGRVLGCCWKVTTQAPSCLGWSAQFVCCWRCTRFRFSSVNYAGLALIVLGIALIVGEAFAPSFGRAGRRRHRRVYDRLDHAVRGRGARISHRTGFDRRHRAGSCDRDAVDRGPVHASPTHTCRDRRRAVAPGARNRARGFRQPPGVSIFTVRSGMRRDANAGHEGRAFESAVGRWLDAGSRAERGINHQATRIELCTS